MNRCWRLARKASNLVFCSDASALATEDIVDAAFAGFCDLAQLQVALAQLRDQRSDDRLFFGHYAFHLCLLGIGQVKIVREEAEPVSAKGEASPRKSGTLPHRLRDCHCRCESDYNRRHDEP